MSSTPSVTPDKNYLCDLSKITKGGGITLVGTFAGKSLFFFYSIFLARVLTADDLGLYFLGATIATFLAVVSNLGMNNTVTRFISIYDGREDIGRMKGVVVIGPLIALSVSITIVMLVLLLADFAAISIFHKPRLAPFLKVLCFSIPFESLMRPFLAVMQGLKTMKYTAFTENLAWIGLRFLFSVPFLYLFRSNLMALSVAYVVSSVISAGLAFFFVNKRVPLLRRDVRPIFEIRSMLKFGTLMSFSESLYMFMRQVDVFMLGLFISSAGIGVYSIVVRIIYLAEFAFQVFMPIFNPFVSELNDKRDFAKLSKLLKIISRWNVTMSLPIFLALLFFPEFFLNIFGSSFSTGASSLSVLVIVHMFSSMAILPSSMIYMSGRSDITLKNNIVILFATVGLNYLLIPRYGIFGAAMANGIALFLVAWIQIVEVFCLFRIHPFDIGLWKPAVAASLSLSATLLICSSLQGSLVMERIFVTPFLLGGLIVLYTLLIFLLRLNDDDLYIRSIIMKKLSFLCTGKGFDRVH